MKKEVAGSKTSTVSATTASSSKRAVPKSKTKPKGKAKARHGKSKGQGGKGAQQSSTSNVPVKKEHLKKKGRTSGSWSPCPVCLKTPEDRCLVLTASFLVEQP